MTEMRPFGENERVCNEWSANITSRRDAVEVGGRWGLGGCSGIGLPAARRETKREGGTGFRDALNACVF